MSDIADQQEINRLNAKVEALEGEVAFVKGQLAGTNKNIAGWLQARDDNLRRAQFAEAQLDEALSGCRETTARAEAAEARAERLRETALHFHAYVKLWTDDVATNLKPTRESLVEAEHIARKALEDDKR